MIIVYEKFEKRSSVFKPFFKSKFVYLVFLLKRPSTKTSYYIELNIILKHRLNLHSICDRYKQLAFCSSLSYGLVFHINLGTFIPYTCYKGGEGRGIMGQVWGVNTLNPNWLKYVIVNSIMVSVLPLNYYCNTSDCSLWNFKSKLSGIVVFCVLLITLSIRVSHVKSILN